MRATSVEQARTLHEVGMCGGPCMCQQCEEDWEDDREQGIVRCHRCGSDNVEVDYKRWATIVGCSDCYHNDYGGVNTTGWE